MSRLPTRLWLLPLTVFALIVVSVTPAAHPAQAADSLTVTFTLNVKSAFLRNAPSFNAARAYSIFQGQTYKVIGRTGDNAWLKLDFVGATTETWIWRGHGTFAGNLGLVTVFPSVTIPDTVGNTNSGASTGASTGQTGARTFVFFTLTQNSVFLRDAPNGNRAYSIFKGQRYEILSKSADGAWLRLNFPGATTEAWVLAVNGTIKGQLANVPVNGATTVLATPAPAGNGLSSSGATTPAGTLPTVSARAREIYQQGLALGNNPRKFVKVGDCMSVNPYFLTGFDSPTEYRLGAGYANLQDTITNFTGSFSRESQAARIGFSTFSLLDSLWANPRYCAAGESPLDCEFRLQKPSLVFISLGTNGEWLTDSDYESSMRRILDDTIARGTLPILSTKADDLEGGGRFNAIMRKLASEYQLPLWDWRIAAEALYNRGITSNSSYQLTWAQAFYDGPASAWTGWQWRNLTALQTLDTVWEGVK